MTGNSNLQKANKAKNDKFYTQLADIELIATCDASSPVAGEQLSLFSEKHLNIRAFTDNEKRKVHERQKGICPHCLTEDRKEAHDELCDMEADHITPWREGGKTIAENCQMLCREHNRRNFCK